MWMGNVISICYFTQDIVSYSSNKAVWLQSICVAVFVREDVLNNISDAVTQWRMMTLGQSLNIKDTC